MSYFERVGSYFYLLNGWLHGSENSEKLVFMSEISENLKRETSSTPDPDTNYIPFPLKGFQVPKFTMNIVKLFILYCSNVENFSRLEFFYMGPLCKL